MKIAIVILNWNGASLLEQFLPSMVKYSRDYATIYVADNASTDNSIDFIRTNFPEVKIVQNNKNGGYAKGYNDALKQIKSNIYCLVNSDIEVTDGWLNPIIKSFSKNDNIAIIQPKILDFKNKTKFEYAGAAGGFLDSYGYPYCRGRLFNTLENDRNQFKDADIFWASGACFFIKSSVFNELNGFDEDLFAHQEEIDLCWRAKNLGHRVRFLNDSEVYHVGGATLNSINPKKTYLNFRNNLLIILKNAPKQRLFKIIFLRLILDGLAGVKFLVNLKPSHAFAILKAHISFYQKIRKFYSKRTKRKSEANYYQHKNLVWQYFILQRKTFRELK